MPLLGNWPVLSAAAFQLRVSTPGGVAIRRRFWQKLKFWDKLENLLLDKNLRHNRRLTKRVALEKSGHRGVSYIDRG